LRRDQWQDMPPAAHPRQGPDLPQPIGTQGGRRAEFQHHRLRCAPGIAVKTELYRDYNSYLREIFQCRVQKITLDAGLNCPNRDGSKGAGGCIYCNARGSGTGLARQGQSVTRQLEAAKAFLEKRYKARKFLAYFQSFSNTYGPLPRLRQLYEEALGVPDIVGLSVGTRPDCVPDAVLDTLAELNQRHLIWVEYGLQSAHDATLAAINRGHDVAAFVDAVQRTRLRGLPICAHVILGLPGESRDHVLATARFLASQDIQAVKIHLLYVVRGTVLEAWHQRGDYRCLTREEYVSLAGDFLTLLAPHMIIQRLTGDPHREELVAPAWALEKQRNLQAIHGYLRDQGLYQGKAYRAGP
jgi:uncharacterized protein